MRVLIDSLTRLSIVFRLSPCVWGSVLLALWPGATVLAEPSPAAPEAAIILVVGDSLSAEYGLAAGSGWVALLAERLASRAPGWRVVNASVSGETTSGGLTRLPALLTEHRPAIVILELGANDALRGLSLAMTEQNLASMARAAQAAQARVLIAGMQIPPNYGRAYAERFQRLFGQVAKALEAAWVPFLLAGFAQDPDYFQADRIHPTAAAQALILENVWPVLAPLLSAARGLN